MGKDQASKRKRRNRVENDLLEQLDIDILMFTDQGLGDFLIAEQLDISPLAVADHWRTIHAVLGTWERSQAVAKAIRRGLIDNLKE